MAEKHTLEQKIKITKESPRFCQTCKKQLVLAQSPCGIWESLGRYLNRKFCSKKCYADRTKLDEGYKRCSACRGIKTLEDFIPCKSNKTGYYAYCRKCHAEYQKQHHPDREEIDEKQARRVGLKRQGLKTCSSCKTVKPINEFYADPNHSDFKSSSCKECAWQKTNKNHLKREYGITREQLILLLDAQNGVCAICKRGFKKNRFNIDHDHETHLLRGVLCINCNTNILPYVELHPDWIYSSVEYLKNPVAVSVLGKIEVPETNQSRVRQARVKATKGENNAARA